MNYTIREMAPSERSLLKDFLYEAIFMPEGEAKPDRDVLEKPELQVYIRDFGCRPGDRCVVAVSGGRVIGAAWARIMNDYGHVDDDTPSLAISVYPQFRGQGAGTAMLRALLKRLAGDGYARASLSVQRVNRAMALYQRLGFAVLCGDAHEAIMVYTISSPTGDAWDDLSGR